MIRNGGCGGMVSLLLIALVLSILFIVHAYARDIDGRYTSNDPKMKAWFDTLESGKGRCCSDADGTAISDSDWSSKAGHYIVLLDGIWLDVPDDAVVTVPNRFGRTMVWPVRYGASMTIRCFMPGGGV